MTKLTISTRKRLSRKRVLAACFIGVSCFALFFAFAQWRLHTRVPASRLRTHFVWSRFVVARPIDIYLPPEYDRDSTRHYPVLYLSDGLSIFCDARPLPVPVWGVDRTMEQLSKAGEIQPLIVVAVHSVPGRRDNDYTFAWDTARHTGGNGMAYARFLSEEVKPLVDRCYRTLPDRAHTAIGGSSLGGLFALSAALRHPDVWGQVAALSPSLWWANHAIQGDLEAFSPAAPRPVIYLSAGTAEPRIAPDTERFQRSLLAHGWRDTVTLRYDRAPGAGHTVAAWSRQISPCVRFLFSPP